jgi:hypothetical protein
MFPDYADENLDPDNPDVTSPNEPEIPEDA